MTSVSAVVTTGIYCRPGCGARPLPENVRKFATAAAAEAAGYRACLRCRPYRLQPVACWSGPEVVCRAVQLILDCALDGKTENDLGARLFISARHLRRLFLEHLGVTPDQLGSAPTHFARRLLDDTDLTITDIAFAAGCGNAAGLATGSSPTAGSSCDCRSTLRSTAMRCSATSALGPSLASSPCREAPTGERS